VVAQGRQGITKYIAASEETLAAGINQRQAAAQDRCGDSNSSTSAGTAMLAVRVISFDSAIVFSIQLIRSQEIY
jgi:hypothetical protein